MGRWQARAKTSIASAKKTCRIAGSGNTADLPSDLHAPVVHRVPMDESMARGGNLRHPFLGCHSPRRVLLCLGLAAAVRVCVQAVADLTHARYNSRLHPGHWQSQWHPERCAFDNSSASWLAEKSHLRCGAKKSGDARSASVLVDDRQQDDHERRQANPVPMR
jgi:hypothetical protein